MNDEIELISDGDGFSVIGQADAVEQFLLDHDLLKASPRPIDAHRLAEIARTAGGALEVGSRLAQSSGRWVKLTAESARAVKQYGLMPSKTPGVSHAMIGKPGDIQKWVQIAHTPVALLSAPVALAALGAMMQQRALQQQIDQIVDYLHTIDEKVDDILLAQKNSAIADMLGAASVIHEALIVRESVGRVSAVTWSKVQHTPLTLAQTQEYAIRELDGIARKIERKADLGDIAKATREAEPRVREWLVVIARCVQLQDEVSVLELDHVLDGTLEDLEAHRLALGKARERRLELIVQSTGHLLDQMAETVRTANSNSKVILNPRDAPAAVRASTSLVAGILELHARLGVEDLAEIGEARRWRQAAAEVIDASRARGAQVIGASRAKSADSVEAARRIAGEGKSGAEVLGRKAANQARRATRAIRPRRPADGA